MQIEILSLKRNDIILFYVDVNRKIEVPLRRDTNSVFLPFNEEQPIKRSLLRQKKLIFLTLTRSTPVDLG